MTAKQVLQKALDTIWNWASRRYQAAVAKELKKYGLRYDDLYDDMYDLDVKKALNRLPQQETKQTPFEPYLQDALQLVKEERREHAELGSDLPYTFFTLRCEDTSSMYTKVPRSILEFRILTVVILVEVLFTCN